MYIYGKGMLLGLLAKKLPEGLLRSRDLLKKEALLTVSLIPGGRSGAQFLGLVAASVRTFFQGWPCVLRPPQLGESQGQGQGIHNHSNHQL